MSTLDSRNNSAYLKRAEQLKRWEESDTNREPITPKNKNPKIKFSSGCIFLAACVAGDKDEVKSLLDQGADIDTTNIDGLTALHQVGSVFSIYFPYDFRLYFMFYVSSNVAHAQKKKYK